MASNEHIYNVDVNMYSYVRCTDVQTCESGQLGAERHIWFPAVTAEMARLEDYQQNNQHLTAVHGGLVHGAGRAYWQPNFGGFYNFDRDGQGPKGPGVTIPGSKTHRDAWSPTEFQHGRWYRFRTWRLGETSPGSNVWNWGFWITNLETGFETHIHSLPMEYAPDLIHFGYHHEVVEDTPEQGTPHPNGPCVTNMFGFHSSNSIYRSSERTEPAAWAFGVSDYYNNNCPPGSGNTTDLRPGQSPNPTRYTINDRQVQTRTTPDGTWLW